MSWYKCIGGNGGSSSSDLLLKYQNGTSGSTTYAIDENGIYLIGVSYSLNGSGSITLPAGRTASYSGTITAGGSGGLVLTVAELQVGDIVTISATPSQWAAFAKFVIKIPATVTTLLDSAGIGDNYLSYTISTGSGDALCVMSCYGRNADTYWDHTTYQRLIAGRNIVAGVAGVQTCLRVFYYDISDFPTILAYGYDGGGVKLAVLQ